MSRYFQQNTFERTGEVENNLIQCAERIIGCVESVSEFIVAKRTGPYHSGLPQFKFHEQMTEYMHCFKQWKDPDGARLIIRIRNALHALRIGRHQIPTAHLAFDALMAQFDLQITRLSDKLVQLSGQDGLRQYEQDAARIDDIAEALFGLLVLTQHRLAADPDDDVTALRDRAEDYRREIQRIVGDTVLNTVNHAVAQRWGAYVNAGAMAALEA